MSWLDTLLSNPGTGTPVLILAITIGVPVVGWMVVEIVRLVLKHRERIAMIEQGIHPDSSPDELHDDIGEQPADAQGHRAGV